ncbi:MAG: cytochrome b N-terminal domain-containing protein [Acidimicrobiales bacterium]
MTSAGPLFASVVNLNAPGHYFHWGFVLISLGNLLVIVAMLVLFVLALLVPFVHSRHGEPPGGSTAGTAPTAPASAGSKGEQGAAAPAGGPGSRSTATTGDPTLWTARLRSLWLRNLPPDKMLPDNQPAYVASWIYVFGVLTMVSLAVVIATGCVLALEGPIWWHESAVGLFVNSLHLWSVECFMGFMAIHLWGKFWMASWRGKRQLTWMTGVVAFLVAVFEAFTGYMSQTNFDSQWIAFEAKDAMNGAGIGAFFNTMNFGQALMLHIVFIPLVLVVIVAIHIVMVRLRGVAPPIDALPEHLGTGGGTADEVSFAERGSLHDGPAQASLGAAADLEETVVSGGQR